MHNLITLTEGKNSNKSLSLIHQINYTDVFLIQLDYIIRVGWTLMYLLIILYYKIIGIEFNIYTYLDRIRFNTFYENVAFLKYF